MMKKLMALLLATLLLPAMAIAQTSCVEVKCEVEVDTAVELLSPLAGEEGEAGLLAAVFQLLDGLSVRVVAQEDASSVEMALAEGELLDLTALWGGEQLVLTSSLMGDDAFSLALNEYADDALVNLLATTPWQSMLEGMAAAIEPVLQSVNVTSVRGSFSGDAFSGGVFCDTYIYDDAQIANLLSAAMTSDFRALLKQAVDYWDGNGADFLARIDARHAAVSAENEYRYILRLVSDASQQPVGFAVTVMRGEAQAATLSVGVNGDTLTIVTGLPMPAQNYWHQHEIRVTQSDEGISLQGEMKEFAADKEYGYALASVGYDRAMLDVSWTLDLRHQANAAAWSFGAEIAVSEELLPFSLQLKGNGIYMPDRRLTNTANISVDGVQLMMLQLSWTPCAPLDTATEDFVLYDLMDPADEEKILQISEELGMALAFRLLKLIPADLLRYLQ